VELEQVIDVNFIQLERSKKIQNFRHRPIGLGGFKDWADAFILHRIALLNLQKQRLKKISFENHLFCCGRNLDARLAKVQGEPYET